MEYESRVKIYILCLFYKKDNNIGTKLQQAQLDNWLLLGGYYRCQCLAVIEKVTTGTAATCFFFFYASNSCVTMMCTFFFKEKNKRPVHGLSTP